MNMRVVVSFAPILRSVTRLLAGGRHFAAANFSSFKRFYDMAGGPADVYFNTFSVP